MILALLLAACDQDPDRAEPTDPATPPTCAAGPTLELGTGAEGYAPLADGDPVTVVHGPQGGWHVDLAGLVAGTPQTVSVVASLTLVDDGEVVAGDQPVDHVALSGWTEDTCAGTFFGRRAFVDDRQDTDQAFVCGLDGREAVLWAEVTDDLTGETDDDRRSVILTLDPKDADACAEPT